MLLRSPGLFAAIALGASLLVTAAASYPLFVSASASALIAERVGDPLVTPFGAGARFRNGTMPLQGGGRDGRSPIPEVDEAFHRLVDPVPNLGPVVATILGPPISISDTEGAEVREVRPLAGDEALAHVHRLDGASDGGTWVPELAADALGIGPGDEIVLSEGRHSTRLVVDGVYRDLYREAVDGYWRVWNDELILYCPLCPPPPQPLIVPNHTFEDVVDDLRLRRGGVSWSAPLDGGLTRDEARTTEAALAEVAARATSVNDPNGEILQRCYTGFCGSRNGPAYASAIGEVMRQVDRRVAAVESPAELLRVAGLLVALVVVAAAGAFAMAARRVEGILLFARGTGPGTIAARASLESALPTVVGALLGLLISTILVRGVGPDGPIAASAATSAVLAAALATIAAIGTIGVVSAVAFLRRSELHRARFAFLAKVPWELALIGLALVIFSRLRSGGALLENGDGATRPSPLVLLFPVLFLAGFAALSARLVVAGLGAIRRRSRSLPPASFLALRRLVDTPQLTLLLVAASGLCIGLFVQAQAMATSMRATMDAKAGVYVGSDVQARVDYGFEEPAPDFPAPVTRVTRMIQGGRFGPNAPFDLLAIDASSFAGAAFWDGGFAQEPLTELVGRLDRPADGGLAVLVARSPTRPPTEISLATSTLPIDVVGSPRTFPGMSSLRPLVIVDEDRLLGAMGDVANPLAAPGASTELWIRASEDDARAAIATLPYAPSLVLTTTEVQDIPHIAAVIDAFLVLNGLGLVAGLLVLAAIVMYLQARQRSQVAAYGLSLRMGMDAAGHRRAVAVELAAMLVLAFLVGTVLAIVATRLVVPLLDPLAAVPPEPIAMVPAAAIILLPFALGLAVIAGAWITERRARSTDLGQVLRLAE